MNGPMNKADAKRILFETDDILRKHGIGPILICGTALGAYREHDFIPHDNDIDICATWEHFKPKVPALIDAFKEAGFRTRPIRKPLAFIRALKLDKDGIHIDFPAFFKFKGVYRGKQEDVRWCPYTYRPISIVLPSKMLEQPDTIDFIGREFLVPNILYEYLHMEYGPAYMVPMRDEWGAGTTHRSFRP